MVLEIYQLRKVLLRPKKIKRMKYNISYIPYDVLQDCFPTDLAEY